jgi:hypothetical protein
MTAQQRIVRVRRNYNQWVANQTLEDYALRFTAKTARRWSSLRVANTAHRRRFFSGAGSHRRVDHGQLRLHQRHCRHRRRRYPHPADQFADRLLRIDLRRGYRSAHARRRLRLSRIDHHLVDLCLLHLPLLRHRSGDHVARLRNVFGHPAFHRLRAELFDRDSVSDAWHHVHQPFSVLDAAGMDRAASPALCLYRVHR